jgi:hypothetical protein
MGNIHVPTGRLTVAFILLALVVSMAVIFTVGASSAQALPTFNQAVNGIGPCDSCHSYTYGDAFHNKATHKAQLCTKCHTVSTATPPAPSACASCHGSAKTIIAAQATHGVTGCGSTAVGCHYASTPTPTPTATAVTTVMIAKVAPTTVKLNKSVTVSGSVTPAAQLTGAKVGILVNRKVGTKWTKAKAATATASTTGAYSWKYKVTKKGSYQVKVSVKATSTYTAKSVTKTFKAK